MGVTEILALIKILGDVAPKLYTVLTEIPSEDLEKLTAIIDAEKSRRKSLLEEAREL